MRRRRFRVVSRPLDGKPRRRLVWVAPNGRNYGLELWTEAEYQHRDPSECRATNFLPGVGYLTLEPITDAEAEDIRAEHREQVSAWRALRGIEGC